ncbi:hypothetical protein CMO89_03120 [Candidatus Woesearchaeota archaeon]|nr:hypothetical protein [Candidatus Woesearchaeota archaeon]|tara:strand:- start:11706 stop:13451 length:1746 start_codon:yes stop_codon:yes gene_type:complete
MPQATIIGVIPQYPIHSKQQVFSKETITSLGLVYVMSQIEGHNIYIIDENNYNGPVDPEGLPDHLELQKARPVKMALFYGGMSISVPRLYSVAQQYQQLGVVTIAGGKHVENMPMEALTSGIDIIVHGDGEKVMQPIVDAIIGKDGNIIEGYKRNLEQILGLSFFGNNGEYVFTGERSPMTAEELSGLKDPNIELIESIEKRWSTIPISWGVGCNHGCEFCAVKDKYRKRGIEKLLNQVESAIDLGYYRFFLVDDHAAQESDSSIEMFAALGDFLRERKPKKRVTITTQIRIDKADNDELLGAMRYAGVTTVCVGYESPIDEELKAMNKGVTVKKLVERSRKLAKNFYIHGMFIFGYPTFKDSKYKSDLTLEEKTKRYRQFFRKGRIDTIQVFNAVPLAGTELREKLDREGRLIPLSQAGWDKYDGGFLCYDSTPEGIDPRRLQDTPIELMERKYMGNALGKVLNYGRWINWTANTLGFPLRFSTSYVKNFFSNLTKKEKSFFEERVSPLGNIFYTPLKKAWKAIKRDWRTTFCNAVAGKIIGKWKSIYRKSNYSSILEKLRQRTKGYSLKTERKQYDALE